MKPVSIFISSPGDVKRERWLTEEIIRRVASEMGLPVDIRYSKLLESPKLREELSDDQANESSEAEEELVLCPYYWEYQRYHADEGYQEQIPRTDQFDLVVCILWSRMGSKLSAKFKNPDGTDPRSGTEFEMTWARDKRRKQKAANPDLETNRLSPALHVYRNRSQRIVPADPNEEANDVEQKKSLEAFLSEWSRDGDGSYTGSFNSYWDLGEFERKFEAHLRDYLTSFDEKFRFDAARRQLLWDPEVKGSPFRSLAVYEPEDAPIFCGRSRDIGRVIDALKFQAELGNPLVLLLGASGSGKSSLARAGVLPLLTKPDVIEGVGSWRHAIFRPGNQQYMGNPCRALAAAILSDDALPRLKNRTEKKKGEDKVAKLGSELSIDARDVSQRIEDELSQLAQRKKAHEIKQLEGQIKTFREEGRSGDVARIEAQVEIKRRETPAARLLLIVDQFEELFHQQDEETKQKDEKDKPKAPTDLDPFLIALEQMTRSGNVFVVVTLRSDFYHRYQSAVSALPRRLMQKLKKEGEVDSGVDFQENRGDSPHPACGTSILEVAGKIDPVLSDRGEVRQTIEEKGEVATGVDAKGNRDDGSLSACGTGLLEFAGKIDLGPPDRDEIGQIIRQPAAAAGFRYQKHPKSGKDLDEEIRDEATKSPESLPLLSLLLDLLVERGREREDRVLTWKDYKNLDFFDGALSKHAENVYERLGKSSKRAFSHVISGLVRTESGSSGDVVALRKEAKLSDLLIDENGNDVPGAEALIDAFSSEHGRLLIVKPDPTNPNEKFVSISHEILLRKWKRIADWVIANLEFLQRRDRVESMRQKYVAAINKKKKEEEAAAVIGGAGKEGAPDKEEDKIEGTPEDYLLPAGLPLEEGVAVVNATGKSVPQELRMYVSMSVAAAEDEAARKRKLKTKIIWCLSGLLLAAFVATIWAVIEQRETKRQLERSQLEEGRAWIERANQALTKKDPLLAMMLAGRAVGFHGFGRRYKDLPEVVAVFPDLLGKMMTDPENEIARLKEIETIRAMVDGIRPTCLPIWSSPLSNHHAGSVNSVAFSPDGTRLASGSSDTTVKLWDAATGKEVAVIVGHTQAVNSVAFSPDGTRLASGSSDTTVKLWDVTTGQEVATFSAHASSVSSVALSPDGTLLASGSDDRTVKLWDVATGNEVATIPGHTEPITSVAFSPDGTRLVSGSTAGNPFNSEDKVRVWDVATGKEVAALSGHGFFGSLSDPQLRLRAVAG